MKEYRKIEIELRGEEEGDIELAFDEVVTAIRDDFTSGFNSNETGSYNFSVITEEQCSD